MVRFAQIVLCVHTHAGGCVALSSACLPDRVLVAVCHLPKPPLMLMVLLQGNYSSCVLLSHSGLTEADHKAAQPAADGREMASCVLYPLQLMLRCGLISQLSPTVMVTLSHICNHKNLLHESERIEEDCIIIILYIRIL